MATTTTTTTMMSMKVTVVRAASGTRCARRCAPPRARNEGNDADRVHGGGQTSQTHTTQRKTMPDVVQKVLVAAACGVLLSSTALPEESWAARSGGRVGGRAFRSAPRPRAAPRSSPRMRSGGVGGGAVYTAPPLVGGYGYGRGYGFNSFFAPPIFFFNPFGSIFQIFLLFVAVQAVLSFGENFRTKNGSFKDDEDDDEDIFD